MSHSRRDFLRLSLGLLGLASCGTRGAGPVPGSIVGANAAVGHLLRDTKAPPHAAGYQDVDVLIVGAGVSGLSAARALHRGGTTDLLVLDLEDEAGGNARGGRNSVSAYPWGAHYVPTPNNDLQEYLVFLQEAGVVTGFAANGLPQYNEYHLCFDPQERLFINGRWQEGLVPHFGLGANDLREVERFLKQMDDFRKAIGRDGRPAFAIPLDASSRDDSFAGLDRLSFRQWLEREGYRSRYVHWYADYCTRDDFGARHDVVSAWAGIHYFAARKGRGVNAATSDVLTWPEGNGFLVKALQKELAGKVRTGQLALRVEPGKERVRVDVLDVATKKITGYSARHCILAVPQFVAARLLQDEARLDKVHRQLHYTPWLVANLEVDGLEELPGTGACWDNVIYDSPSLGYVTATHQLIRAASGRRNITWYQPLTDASPEAARRAAYGRSHADWAALAFTDLERVHANIRAATKRLDVLLWGHAMAQPLPGLLLGPERATLATAPHRRVHFAHSDLAGISIFEEAFYQGLNAARQIETHG
ncbi:flavin monoamine oxidase family protein [Flaviaesturariibacter aridisoli]|uniref:FAD-dependent oxidoreductase n=1 Tax=Flaviaesturariibacter aridisoli TaxID=2545761 RepID=A0A4R4DSP8_9BACT|nr:FAD-dependent oxidoreductase [Flaviaesturariibacter aridisoli]TCZ65686.1 FAD-dependent oxidoreductase [Flaviaesturariibacter aridisoli]